MGLRGQEQFVPSRESGREPAAVTDGDRKMEKPPLHTRLLMGGLILAVAAVAIVANIWKGGLPVRSVRPEGNHIVVSSEILRLAAVPNDAKLFDVDLYGVQKRVRQNPFIRAVSVNRQGPEGISIAVVERMPVAALVTDQMLYVDEEGIVLPAIRSDRMFDLPVLTGAIPDAECAPGRRLTKEPVREALQLLLLSRRISEDLYRTISEVHVGEDGELTLHTAEFGVPVLVGRGDLPAKLVKLDGFWRGFVDRRGARELQYVDLRFEDQVVARWNNGLAQK
jgi:cell division protein FtsQ